jgi:hypothetical protein
MPATVELFKKYINPIFIETGSEQGIGIQQALDAGFEEIYSIELTDKFYNMCLGRYKDNPNVHLIQGDSGEELGRLLQKIDRQATLWLDAHLDCEKTPLMKELASIKEHPIKTHTIMVDDLREWKVAGAGFDTGIIYSKLLEINPNYKLIFEDGYTKKDILVATI